MGSPPTALSEPLASTDLRRNAALPAHYRAWHNIRGRILAGLMVVMPIAITFWVVSWLYSPLEKYVIDPLALLVLWKVAGYQRNAQLPFWFEADAAPLIGLMIGVLLLYACGYLVHSRLRRVMDWLLLRIPVVSSVYQGVRSVFQSLEKGPGEKRPQRTVLVAFPHPGMKVPAFVTSSCRDIKTDKIILCVYVPTTPVPTSGYFLLVPEEEVTELNWSSEQALQAIISAGLTAPPEIGYYNAKMETGIEPVR
jgi:uncharacterized membrane protein